MEHQFNTEVAVAYGIDAAVIIHNLFWWINKNAANERHYHDGRYWTYNSAKAMAQLFPYMSAPKISRILSTLTEKGILVKGNYNESPMDRRLWFAFTETGISFLQSCGYHFCFFKNGENENVKCLICNTDSKTDNKNTDSKTDGKEARAMSLDFPFRSEKFLDMFNALCKQPKWKAKTREALQMNLNKLGRYDEEFAIMLMEDAIARGWQGVVFSDTDDRFARWQAERQRAAVVVSPEPVNQRQSKSELLLKLIDDFISKGIGPTEARYKALKSMLPGDRQLWADDLLLKEKNKRINLGYKDDEAELLAYGAVSREINEMLL